MYNFASDYLEGAHPTILKALNETNYVQTPGYGVDEYCLKASKLLKQQLGREDVDIHYLVGGTQTNMIVISAALKPYQAVITVDSGHINVHETGAVEFSGHKIITCPHVQGKLEVKALKQKLSEFQDEHMVMPKMVYISQTTEYGTYYTKTELKALADFCHQHQLYLFVDGARLGSSLVLEDAPTLKELASWCDVFYFGGTKLGALFGECLVIVSDDLKPDFRYHLKQKGAMLAKGRLLGVQFMALFNKQLYLEIGKQENECAQILKNAFLECGYHMYIDTVTNQIFPLVDQKTYDYLFKRYIATYMFNEGEQICLRFVTSWATDKQVCLEFARYLKDYVKG